MPFKEPSLETIFTRKRVQWEHEQNHSLVEYIDEAGEEWVSKEYDNVEGDSYEQYRIYELALARFLSITGLEIPKTILINNNGKGKLYVKKVYGVLLDDSTSSEADLAKIEYLLVSLLYYYLITFGNHEVFLKDINLAQFMLSKDGSIYLIDLDPFFDHSYPIFNFFRSYLPIEQYLKFLVDDYKRVLDKINDIDWGKDFIIHLNNAGYSLEELSNWPQLKLIIELRHLMFNDAPDVTLEEISTKFEL